jgi:hypothetical protein
MGGSGGGSFSGRSDADTLVAEAIRRDETKFQLFEISVAGLISELLAKYNARDPEVSRRHLETITQALNKEFDLVVSTLFGGSVAKHTYVDGLSDVDALLVINPQHSKKLATPAELRDYFAERIADRLKQSRVEVGSLAVSVLFGDARVQVIPVLREKNTLKISNEQGTGWLRIRPKEFSESLAQLNRDLNGKVVPIIKLAKAIINSLPEDRRLSGFHTEALALRVFEGYTDSQKSKDMLKHFFRHAPQAVLKPITDPTGQSAYVDQYLGAARSLPRQIASDALDRIGRRMRNADGAMSIELWQQILDVTPESKP